MKIERTLAAWSHIIMKVVTDEDIEDMEWAVVAGDHGDQYLYVKTKDKKLYKYGCFANLKYTTFPIPYLMTQPKLFKELKTKTSEVYWLVHRQLYEDDYRSSFRREDIRKCYSKETAQRTFDGFIEQLNSIHDTCNEMYDDNDHKDDAMKFLIKNEIDTEENIEKLNSAYWDSRIDGVDGIAGKRDISGCNCIYFEHLGDVYVVNKEDLEIVNDYDPDEYGCTGYYLNVEPDLKLVANKKLYASIFGEESIKNANTWTDDDDYDDEPHEVDCSVWCDSYNEESFRFPSGVEVMFNRTVVKEETNEVYYLVVDNTSERPLAAYMTFDDAKTFISQEV